MCDRPGASGPVFECCGRCKRQKHFCQCSSKCILSCCLSCTFCNKCQKAVRCKTSVRNKERSKICEKYFYCRSLCLCPKCVKCPQCCTCSASGRSPAKLLAEMVPPGRKSKGRVDLKGRLHSSIQTQTSSSKRSVDSQWVCKPRQEPLPEGSFACTDSQNGSRECEGSNLSSLFQQAIHSSKTKSEMGPILDFNALNRFLSVKAFKMETPETIRISLQQRDAYLHIPIHNRSWKFLRFHFQNQTISSSLFPLASQQLLWSSLAWSRGSS